MRYKEFVYEDASDIKTAYHITTESNADKITKIGLEPRNDKQHNFYNNEGRIYLLVDTNDIGQVRQWMGAKLDNDGIFDDPLTLLKINVEGVPLKYENGWHFATKNISPDRITDLGWRELDRY